MEDFLLPCLNKEIFGIECYGCGGQRAVLLFLNGEFIAAFKMFPAIYPLLLLLVFVVINMFYRFRHDFTIKIGLILFTTAIIFINYAFKMFHFFN